MTAGDAWVVLVAVAALARLVSGVMRVISPPQLRALYGWPPKDADLLCFGLRMRVLCPQDLLTRHKRVVAQYLSEHYQPFFEAYNKLLRSSNYVTRRQSLKVGGLVAAWRGGRPVC